MLVLLDKFKMYKNNLEKAGKHAKYSILSKCGHTPWLEKFNTKQFYKILELECKI